MTVAALVPRLRESLSIHESYEATWLPALVRRQIARLLRDYHFPKALQVSTYPVVDKGNIYVLPQDFKKIIAAHWFDLEGSVYSYPLERDDSYLGDQDGYYRIVGTQLVTSLRPHLPHDAELHLFYESSSVALNENWLTADFEDVLYTLCMFRASAELGKPELTQTYAALWAEDQRSLAIYLAEVRWSDMAMYMKAAGRSAIVDRYSTRGAW